MGEIPHYLCISCRSLTTHLLYDATANQPGQVHCLVCGSQSEQTKPDQSLRDGLAGLMVLCKDLVRAKGFSIRAGQGNSRAARTVFVLRAGQVFFRKTVVVDNAVIAVFSEDSSVATDVEVPELAHLAVLVTDDEVGGERIEPLELLEQVGDHRLVVRRLATVASAVA